MRRQNVLRLAYIGQVRLMTVPVFQRRFLRRAKLDAAATWLKRRCADGHLQRFPLFGKRQYWCLTPKALRLLANHGIDLPRTASRRLAPLTKAECYAALLFYNSADGPLRMPYRPKGDTEFVPELGRIAAGPADPFRRKLFYRDDHILGYFMLDRGQPQFIRRKVFPKVHKLTHTYPDVFASLARDGRFELTIATAFPPRRAELLEELSSNPPPFRAHVIAMPELEHVLVHRQPKVTLL